MAVLLGSVQALVNLCLLHPHTTHITDLPHTCPRPQLRLGQNISIEIAYQRGVEGHVPPLLVSLITKCQLQINSPDNWHPPPHFPQEQRWLPRPACYLPHKVVYHSRILLHTCKNPHPLNHWRLCCWLRIFSSVSRLGLQACRAFCPTVSKR